ncbi:MAG: tetratricopeptide repeat protein, partial [Verrucomicrobiota bacterium]
LLDFTNPPRETVAWCRWQLGETAFSHGDYKMAERHYRAALITSPGYVRATAALGRVCAANGDRIGAITYYEQAVRTIPTQDFLAALGDLYKLEGREKGAAIRYEVMEQIAEHTLKVHGTPHNRPLALFYADHDMKLEQAYALALAEYAIRKDIYGADTLAWTALKTGRIEEAQSAIKDALRLGTQDAKLFYHAGMIALARHDETAGRDYLKRALDLNPHFDPLQTTRARAALKN